MTRCLFWVTSIALAVLMFAACAWAEEPAPPHRFMNTLDVAWDINPAGQLVLQHDPLHTGSFDLTRRHTVVLIDNAPKLCGDPDGTGRHTWFFTEALLIERLPVPSSPPSTFHKK